MAAFFDYDPVTGMTEHYDYDWKNEKHIIRSTQDVSGVLEYAKAHRDNHLTDSGIKKGWWKYAVIPTVVQMELLKKGISLTNPRDTKRLIREINENYPYLKTTDKTHG